MKRLVSLALSLALVGVLSACGGGDQAQEPAPAPAEKQEGAGGGADAGAGGGGTVDASAAEAKFNQSCASCHGQDLSGGAGPALQAVGSKYSKDQILGIIQNGQGAMPPGMLQGEDAELVASWLAEKK